MRKGIKKWRSKIADIAALNRKNRELKAKVQFRLKQVEILEKFVLDIYKNARNNVPLTIEDENLHYFLFLRDNVGLDIRPNHAKNPVEIEKPRSKRGLDHGDHFEAPYCFHNR